MPVHRDSDYDPKFFVTRPNPVTGEQERILHHKGSFVYRLSGRERSAPPPTTPLKSSRGARSARPRRTPHRQDNLPGHPRLHHLRARPGLGAFLNQAINQLADAYLDRAQHECDKQLLPDRLEIEKQKVKAYLALHNCYGVDLNATAVELAEVSIWLNVMHEKLEAPWFGLHLRRGNSLIGARRATYNIEQLRGVPGEPPRRPSGP